jgi:hypothetical protein
MARSLLQFSELDNAKPGFVLEYAIPRFENPDVARKWFGSTSDTTADVAEVREEAESGQARTISLQDPVYVYDPWIRVPDHIIDRCVSFEYKDCETVDSLQLKFRNDNLILFQSDEFADFREIIRHGTLLRFRFGYENLYSSWKYMKTFNPGGFQEVVLTAYELAPARLLKQGCHDNLEFEDKTLGGIVRKVGSLIFKQAGEVFGDDELEKRVVVTELIDPSSTPDDPIALELDEVMIDQSMNYLCFLQTLADEYGYQVWFEDESITDKSYYVLYFKPRDFLRASTWKWSYFGDIEEAKKLKSDYLSVDGKYTDLTYGGTIIKVNAANSETRDKMIYDRSEEIDPKTGDVIKTRFQYADMIVGQTGEQTFIRRSLQQIHGMGQLGDDFLDLKFLDSERHQDENNQGGVGVRKQIDPEIDILATKMFLLERILTSPGHFPTEEELENIEKRIATKTKVSVKLSDMMEIDSTNYGREWLIAGPLKEVIWQLYGRIRQEFRDRSINQSLQEDSDMIERSYVAVTNNVKELHGMLYGKNFRQMSSVMKMSFNVPGNPDIKARQVSEIVGTGAYDTKWYHLEVTHTINRNGFISKIQCISNSTLFTKEKKLKPESHPWSLRNRLEEFEKGQVDITAERSKVQLEHKVNAEYIQDRTNLKKEGTAILEIVETINQWNINDDPYEQATYDHKEYYETVQIPQIMSRIHTLIADVARFNQKWGEHHEKDSIDSMDFRKYDFDGRVDFRAANKYNTSVVIWSLWDKARLGLKELKDFIPYDPLSRSFDAELKLENRRGNYKERKTIAINRAYIEDWSHTRTLQEILHEYRVFPDWEFQAFDEQLHRSECKNVLEEYLGDGYYDTEANMAIWMALLNAEAHVEPLSIYRLYDSIGTLDDEVIKSSMTLAGLFDKNVELAIERLQEAQTSELSIAPGTKPIDIKIQRTVEKARAAGIEEANWTPIGG